MTYQQTIEFLFNSLPMFSRVGAPAYKEGLDTTIALDNYFGNPHRGFRSIHVAGTNGKGSTSQMIYEALRAEGYSVGLYTSPHLLDFRERIVVDGEMISREAVVDFVAKLQEFMTTNPDIQPSFFEMSVALAFDYFASLGVDYAVVEVGMGGRLDSTNIIMPELCVITNISLDHTQFLGSTLPEIAGEKAGIIKHGVRVVVGESHYQAEHTFRLKAARMASPIVFADQVSLTCQYQSAMGGDYQKINARTAQVALELLGLSQSAIEKGITSARVSGRWEVLSDSPLTVCDTGHNKAGIEFVVAQIRKQTYDKLCFVLGVVADKDISAILELLPRDAHYLFTNAAIARALGAEDLAAKARQVGLQGEVWLSVESAVSRARQLSTPRDMIFIGGSTFVVAEALAL